MSEENKRHNNISLFFITAVLMAVLVLASGYGGLRRMPIEVSGKADDTLDAETAALKKQQDWSISDPGWFASVVKQARAGGNPDPAIIAPGHNAQEFDPWFIDLLFPDYMARTRILHRGGTPFERSLPENLLEDQFTFEKKPNEKFTFKTYRWPITLVFDNGQQKINFKVVIASRKGVRFLYPVTNALLRP